MKKRLALMFAALLAFSLVGCGGENSAKEPDEGVTESDSADVETGTETNAETSAENPYADLAACAEYAVEQLKSVLKNPSSLIVNNLYAVEGENDYIFAMDYSAENGFGGMNQDNFFLAVHSIENGFAVTTYGTGTFAESENQMYSSKDFEKYNQVSGCYILDPETYTVTGIDESAIDPEIDNRVELVGKMKGEKDESTGFGGAWDFEVEGSSVLQVVYFAEGTDLSWYEQFTGKPYEITISAVKGEDGHYREAKIVEDPIRESTDDERLERFNYYDRTILATTIPESGMEPMSGEDVKGLLTDATFSMRNNYGGDGDGTHTITFHGDGTLDAVYTYDGKEYSMYQAWRVENGSVVCTNSFTNTSGEAKTVDYLFTPYQYDDTRYVLLAQNGDYSMVLTVQ